MSRTQSNHNYKVGDIFYRYQERYAGEGKARVTLEEWPVTKVTPCGVWVSDIKLVLIGARKQFANPTKEEAKTAFFARKAKQLRILRTQVAVVEHAVSLVQQGKYEDDPFTFEVFEP